MSIRFAFEHPFPELFMAVLQIVEAMPEASLQQVFSGKQSPLGIAAGA